MRRGVEWKDCLQVWRLLFDSVKRLTAESRNADHADISVVPEINQIVAVPFARAAAIGLADPARRPDHMDTPRETK
jgi:hypothetical protein